MWRAWWLICFVFKCGLVVVVVAEKKTGPDNIKKFEEKFKLQYVFHNQMLPLCC